MLRRDFERLSTTRRNFDTDSRIGFTRNKIMDSDCFYDCPGPNPAVVVLIGEPQWQNSLLL